MVVVIERTITDAEEKRSTVNLSSKINCEQHILVLHASPECEDISFTLNGCPTVHHLRLKQGAEIDSGDLESIRQFNPDHLVLFGVLEAVSDPVAVLNCILNHCGDDTKLTVVGANASFGGRLLDLLTDSPDAKLSLGMTLSAWRELFRACGLEVAQVNTIDQPISKPEGLSKTTAMKLNQLFTQFNPSATARYFIFEVISAPDNWTSHNGNSIDRLNTGQLSILIRFHDPSKIDMLDQAVFSLCLQDWDNLELIICTKNFSDADVARTEHTVWRQPWRATPKLKLCKLDMPPEQDARVLMLNEGQRAATGQYFAFLDYDDVVYRNGYAALIKQLEKQDVACAVGGCQVSFGDFADYTYIHRKEPMLETGTNLPDLWRRNFIPIHSYVLNRALLPSNALEVPPEYVASEDTYVIWKMSSLTDFDFSQTSKPVCEYRLRGDGTNSGYLDGKPDPTSEKWKPYFRAQERLRQYKERHVSVVSLAEGASRPIPPEPEDVFTRSEVQSLLSTSETLERNNQELVKALNEIRSSKKFRLASYVAQIFHFATGKSNRRRS